MSVTINLFKLESPLELKVQKVEALMNELGLSFSIRDHSLNVETGGDSYAFVDMDSQHNKVIEFPRRFEGVRIRAADTI